MQPLAGQNGFYGVTSDEYFIDIGIPEDYYRAQREFVNLFPADEFLFLDRDGVLNTHILGDYVRNWNMWEWIDGVLPKMAELAKRYKRIFLVSNQQGVGKGRMTQADLDDIHRRMMADITAAGGRIDRIYTCTELESSNSPMRKPEIGMALQAQQDFPEVDFSRAVMVGDNVTDMLFARNAQLRAVYITKNNPVPDSVRDITDLTIECLPALGL
ncbi:MAG: HAD-IIIA family hydrolase [Paludibacteraceae bacterium]|nr:HAD-IIIA family hydrolase [Paludibacteraceae bacterium]